jgi:hypothetical protein
VSSGRFRAGVSALVLIVTGYNAAEVGLVIRDGGGGTVEVWLAVPNTENCVGPLETFSDVLETARADGSLDSRIEYSPHTQSGLTGFLFSTEFTSATDVEARLANVRNIIRTGDNTDLAPEVFDLQFVEEATSESKSSRIEIAINPNDLFIGPLPESECRLEAMDFRLTMPEAVRSFGSVPDDVSGEITGTRRVEWSVPIVDRTFELSARSERSIDPVVVTEPEGTPPYAAIGIGVAVIGIVVTVIVSRRRH